MEGNHGDTMPFTIVLSMKFVNSLSGFKNVIFDWNALPTSRSVCIGISPLFHVRSYHTSRDAQRHFGGACCSSLRLRPWLACIVRTYGWNPRLRRRESREIKRRNGSAGSGPGQARQGNATYRLAVQMGDDKVMPTEVFGGGF